MIALMKPMVRSSKPSHAAAERVGGGSLPRIAADRILADDHHVSLLQPIGYLRENPVTDSDLDLDRAGRLLPVGVGLKGINRPAGMFTMRMAAPALVTARAGL